ncbi:hypothetical protein [Tunicatimonas pelagia]|uniref:hypothetical protein n=1 Tax=Tunicatimonas pelagia TaxID=931531 RepID=UPI0026660744|nr:hypothetical protein [Tunicatimonas pelagia]WKN43432.1 hypothetical protein P0M28_00410 [Tunicatimonas pelagia]
MRNPQKAIHYTFGLLFLCLTILSCNDDDGVDDPTPIEQDTTVVTNPPPAPPSQPPALPSFDCSVFTYPDTLFFISEAPNNLVSPDSALVGTYSSYPLGLAIDPATGVIDVNASETGLKYEVRFIPTGTTDTCRTFVTISGINYLDKIYVLSTGDSLALPIYNASPMAMLPCNDDDDDEDDEDDDDGDDDTDDDDSECEFDDGADDDDGDGDDDEPAPGQEVIPQGVAINKADGSINLQQTLNNGTFGSTTPANGTFQDYTIFYRLNDASNEALNSIDVRFYYYETEEDVPQSIIDEIADRNSFTFTNSRLLKNAKTMDRNGRPPYLLIVRTPQR